MTLVIVKDETPALLSPLGMVSQEPLLNDFVAYLSGLLPRLQESPGESIRLAFSRARLSAVRHAFQAMILRGEEKLHRLSNAVCEQFLTSYEVQSVVVGEVDATKERFVLSQPIATTDLYSTLDIDLGSRQLDKLRFRCGESWSPATLVANFVEYQPTEPNPQRIQKLVSRIKAEEEIWNKVVDEIFDLDGMIRRDKQMSHLSFFVKDVFGLKIVVGLPSDVMPLHQTLIGLKIGGEPVELIETKDYHAQESKKASGWTAMKSVISWSGKTFEVQIQPLRIYYNEREFLTKESHSGFKSRRDTLRNQIAEQLPLFSFYQALLKWLFLSDADPKRTPVYPSVDISVTD